MRNVLFLLFSCLLFTPLAAQMTEDDRVGIFYIQWQQTDFDGFNAQLAAIDLPALDGRQFEAGFVGQQRFGRWISGFGAGYARALAGRNTDELAGGTLQTFALRAETTFSVIRPGSRWILGPMINVMPQWSRMAFSYRDSAADLQQALETSSFRMSRFSSPMEVGIHFLYQAPFGDEDLFVIGLTAGYRFDDDEGWRVEDATEIRESGAQVQGWFAGLRFGFRLDK
jgi:hypothetical protein